MKTQAVRCWVAGIVLAVVPVAEAQFLRDHYAPGVTPSEGLGGSVAVNAKYLIGGRPGYDGNRGDVVVFDTVTGQRLRVLSAPADDRQAGDQFGFAVALRGEEAVVSAPGDTSGLPSGSGSLYFFDLRTGRLRSKLAGPGGYARLGHALAAEGARVVAGAPESAAGGTARGRALLVENEPGSATFNVRELVPDAVENNAKFGTSVAVHGRMVAVGAPFFDSGALVDSGRVHVFNLLTTSILPSSIASPTPAAGANYGWVVGLTGDSVVVGSQVGGRLDVQGLMGSPKFSTTLLGTIRSLAVSGRFIAVGTPIVGSVAADQGFVTVLEANAQTVMGIQVLYSVTPQLGLVGDERFGTSVALHEDLLAGGAPGRFFESSAGGGQIGSLLLARRLAVPLQTSLLFGGVRELVTTNDNAPQRDGASVRAPLELALGTARFDADAANLTLALTGAGTSGGRGQMWAIENRALSALRQSSEPNVSSGRISGFSASVANVANFFGVQVSLTGTGITSANNAAFLSYDTVALTLSEIFRKGQVLAGRGAVKAFQPPRMANLSGQARYLSVLQLGSSPGLPVTAANDTGVRVMLPTGLEATFVREGDGSPFGVNYGQIGPWIASEDVFAVFPAALVGSPAGVGLTRLNMDTNVTSAVERDGNAAAGVAGATFGSFPSAQCNNFSGETSFRATLRGAPTVVKSSNNEGLWRRDAATTLILRKGSSPPGAVALPAVKRILKHWVLSSSGATRALVQFSGPGVTSANDQALLEINLTATSTEVLMREGDPAPGCHGARIGTLLRVDADRTNAYAVLVTLVNGTGVASAGNNLALYARPSANTSFREPILMLRKGTLMQRPGSPPLQVTSLAFAKNVTDTNGAAASGLPHALSSSAPSERRPVSVGVLATWNNRTQSALCLNAP